MIDDWSVISRHEESVVIIVTRSRSVMKGGGREGNCDGYDEEMRFTAGLYN